MIIAIITTTIKDKTKITTHKDHVTTMENLDISQEIVAKAKIIITTIIIIEKTTNEIMQKIFK